MVDKQFPRNLFCRANSIQNSSEIFQSNQSHHSPKNLVYPDFRGCIPRQNKNHRISPRMDSNGPHPGSQPIATRVFVHGTLISGRIDGRHEGTLVFFLLGFSARCFLIGSSFIKHPLSGLFFIHKGFRRVTLVHCFHRSF